MRKRPFRWQPLAGALALVALVAVVAVAWEKLDAAKDIDMGAFAQVALGAAVAIVGVVAWVFRSKWLPDLPLVADLKAAAEVLAQHVEQQWSDEARHLFMEDPHPIPVRWRLTANESLMSPRHLIARADFVFEGRSNDIEALAHQFRALERRRLVIVGGPGTGKTTLAVQLLLRLLADRSVGQAAAQHDEVVPVPVLLPVSGWNPDAHPTLQDWLADRLVRDYPALKAPQLGPDVAAALVRSGYILPVLDGLDEIGQEHCSSVLTALNSSLTERDQLILTSRRDVFKAAVEQAGQPVLRAAVIVPAEITPRQAADYLRSCLPGSPPSTWEKVFDVLISGKAPGLAAMAATPLGLWLIRAVYCLTPGTNPAPLAGPLGSDSATLRAHLLDQLIPAVIKARPPSANPADLFRPRHRWDPDDTRRYLSQLARIFPPGVTRDITWWHIARTLPRFWLALRLATQTIIIITAGFAGYLIADPRRGVVLGIVTACLMASLWLVWRQWRWINDPPGYVDLRLRGGRTLALLISVRRNAGQVIRWHFFYLFYGVILAPIVFLNRPIGQVLAQVGSLILMMGLVRGFGAWMEQPVLASVATPYSSWRGSRTLILVLALGGVLIGGLGGLAGTLLGGSGAAGVLLSLWAVSLIITTARHRAWLACVMAVARLAATRQLPWTIMNFLDDAHRLGLLRAVGPVYQFRHANLHDHLAAARDSEPPGPTRRSVTALH